MFKKFILSLISFSLIIGCAAKVENKVDRTADIQNNADKAFQELDSAIQNDNTNKYNDTIKSEDKKPEQTKNSSGTLYNEKTNPMTFTDKAKPSMQTKYPIKDGYPVWVLNPNIVGSELVAIGSAKPQSSGVSGQKKAARMQAQAELSRMINIQVDNELQTYKLSNKAQTDIQQYSRQKSNEYLSKIKTIDEWFNPSNKDYYIIIGIEK